MPTIDQLAPATAATDADAFPVSQNGITRKLQRSQILAGLQPAIALTPGSVLGRFSDGVGKPETLAVGSGLTLSATTLSVTTPLDVSLMAPAAGVADGDLLPVAQSGSFVAASRAQLVAGLQPRITAPQGALLGRVSTGTGGPEAVAIGTGLRLSGGTLTASPGPGIDTLPAAGSIANTDVLAVSQGGTAAKATRAQLVAGLQPQITTPQGSLLGRASTGAGGPETIAVGSGLAMAGGALTAIPAPSVDSLTAAVAVAASDLLAISQGGVPAKATRAQLVAGLQPQITLPTASLLGRASAGAGAPETLSIGANLTLSGGVLAANASSFVIDALPAAAALASSDSLAVSQSGVAGKTTRAQFLAGTQPALSLPQGALLGRSSAGAGAPETVAIGANLSLSGGTLSAAGTPFVIATLPAAAPLADADLLPVSQGGAQGQTTRASLLAGTQPKLTLNSATLLGRASAGAGAPEALGIGANLVLSGGTLSGPAPFVIATLPAAGTVTDTDLVAISQNGTQTQTSRATLLASAQPKITTGSGTLLGRSSPGAGGPETLSVGANLTLAGGVLSALPPFVINTLPVATAVADTDLLPLSQAGAQTQTTRAALLANTQPRLNINPGVLLGRTTAGAGAPKSLAPGDGLTLSAGTLSATGIETLPAATAPAATDLVLLRQGGVSKRVTYQTLIGGMASLPGVDGSGLAVQASGTNRARNLAARFSDALNVRDFGAVGDGSTDDTAAIQATIAAAQASPVGIDYFGPVYKRVHLPAGRYSVSGLDITGRIAFVGDGHGATTIGLRAAANRSVLRLISPGAPSSDSHSQQVLLKGFSINGYAGAQTATSHGIELVDDYTHGYQSGAFLEDVYVQGCANDCLYIGAQRNTGYAERCKFLGSSAGNGVTFNAYDWGFVNCEMGQSYLHCLNIIGGAGLQVTNCNIYGSTTGHCVKIANPAGAYFDFVNCSIDSPNLNNVWIDGSAGGQPGALHVAFTGGRMSSPSHQGDGLNSFVYVQNWSNLSLIGMAFMRQSTDNHAKYLVETAASYGRVWWFGCAVEQIDPSLIPFATGLFNTPGQVVGFTPGSNSGTPTAITTTPIEIAVGASPQLKFTDPGAVTNYQSFGMGVNSQRFMAWQVNATGALTPWLTVTGGNGAVSGVYLGGDNNHAAVWIKPTGGFANGVQLVTAGSGSGPTIQPAGTDATIRLNLAGAGGGGVQMGGTGDRLGFAGRTPVAVPTISGSRGGSAALASLITQLASLGLVTDGTVA